MKLIRTITLAVALIAPAAAQAQDIVDIAAKDPQFSTLVTAVKAAGLVDALKGKGPLTVFAPTDEAFKKLPAGTLDTLLKPENKAQLTSILTYHVLNGAYSAERLTKASAKKYAVKSLEGSDVQFDITKGVVVSGATVTKPDIAASNGTIHVIDTVILPPKIKRQMQFAAAKARATELAKKAYDATKAATTKAYDATKDAAKKAYDATKAAAGKAVEKAKELAKPAEAPKTGEPAPAAKKP